MYFTQIVEQLEAVLREMGGVGILLLLHYLMQDFLNKMKMLIAYPLVIKQWGVCTTTSFSYPLTLSNVYQAIPVTDFTWISSGGVNTQWFASKEVSTSTINFYDDQRRKIIVIGK